MRNAIGHGRSKAAIFLGAAVAFGLAVVIAFIAIRAQAPVQEGSLPASTPAPRPATSSTEGLPTAPDVEIVMYQGCLLYTSPSPRDLSTSRMPSSA